MLRALLIIVLIVENFLFFFVAVVAAVLTFGLSLSMCFNALAAAISNALALPVVLAVTEGEAVVGTS